MDDHKYWANQQPDRKPNPLMSKKWGDISDGIETDLGTFSRESGEQDGDFLDQLKIENRERYDYREFLRKFAVFREELTVDPDSFDYNFYTYGLSLYGNMPLIETPGNQRSEKSFGICHCDRYLHVLFRRTGTEISGGNLWDLKRQREFFPEGKYTHYPV